MLETRQSNWPRICRHTIFLRKPSCPRPDAVDLVDQPLPRIVDENRFVVLVVDASKIDHPDRPENIEGHYADHSTDDIGPD